MATFPQKVTLTIDGESQDYAISAPPAPTVSSIRALIDLISSSFIIERQSVHVSSLTSDLGVNLPVDMKYEWNFGDPTGDHNVLPGYNAAHTYLSAGHYSISLRLTAPNGAVSIATQTITVVEDTRPTLYVDAVGGNDGDAGVTDIRPIKSVGRAIAGLHDGMRLLFKSGQTFEMTKTIGIEYTDVTIGRYGTGAPPILKWIDASTPNPNVIACGDKARNLVIDGLHFDGGPVKPYAFSTRGKCLTIRNCSFVRMYTAISNEGGPVGLLIENCETPPQAEIEGYVVWMQGVNLTIIGNHFVDGGLATMRGHGVGKPFDLCLIHDNTFINSARATLTIQRSDHSWVSGNVFTGTGINVGPLSSGDAKQDPDWQNAKVTNVMIMGNVCNFQSGHRMSIITGAEHVRIDSNVITSPEAPKFIWIDPPNVTLNRSVVDVKVNGLPVTPGSFVL